MAEARTLLVVLSWWISSASAACAAAFGDCYNSTCCANGNFGCMRKAGKQYAQCRPMPGGSCVQEDGWDCPGWEDCTGNFGNCLATKCCKGTGFGCFRKPQGDFAMCRQINSDVTCKDTEEWLCPGWQLCSDSYQACTDTSCCADRRFVCYQKRPHFSQCMRSGTCVPGRDGDCEEVSMQLGQCSAPFHDCHLSGCCQRGEDHCYLKNSGYGQCRPSCTTADQGADWACTRHELPSERFKVTCATLKDRTNIYKRLCSTQYESEKQCNDAFRSDANIYLPCAWRSETNACDESGQSLACDCTLHHQNCPVHENAGDESNLPSGGGGDTTLVIASLLIIICGCAGLGSYVICRRSPSGRQHMIDNDASTLGDEDEGEAAEDAVPKKRKKKKDKGYAKSMELESTEL